MSRGIILLSYFTNTEAYQERCQNKARPQLHCEGKCQVAKKIKEASSREQKDPHQNFKFQEFSFIDTNNFARIHFVPRAEKDIYDFLLLSIGAPRERSRSLFRPPDTV